MRFRNAPDFALVISTAVSDGLQLQWSAAPGEVDLLGGIRVYSRRSANEVVAPAHAGAVAMLADA